MVWWRLTVIGFDVAMEDTALVYIFYGAGELGEDIPDFGWRGKILWNRVEAGSNVLIQA